jgi:RNA polymerase sigma-70 factor, ECF subfamily
LIDQELIEECKKGNLLNFKVLVGIVSPFAFSVAFRMIGDEDMAKDVVQETMITLWEKLEKIRSVKSFKTWLYRIVVNKCYDHFRKKKTRNEIRADEKTWLFLANHISEEQSSELENQETARIINLLTDKLSPKQKAVFVLSDLEEMTAEDISAITGMSKSNVKANLFYARKNITEMIEKYI